MEEYITKFIGKKKTATQQCYDYIVANPQNVAKGAVAGVVAWYTAPIAIAAISWAPYLGVVYLVYKKTAETKKPYSLVQGLGQWWSSS